MALPLVSVVTPVWTPHRDVVLDRCIPSVQAQTHWDVEHVVVSDGPDPGLHAELSRRWHENRLGKLMFDQLPEHDEAARWGHHARLRGIELARGELICYLDADNAFRPQHVEHLAAALAENPGAGFAYSRILMQGNGTEYVVGASPPVLGQIDTSSIMHRRELLDVATWRYAGHQATVDWDLVARWLDAGIRWAFVDEVTADYYFASLGGPAVGTWALTATGTCPAEAETRLRELLGDVLSDPQFGMSASQFGGETHNGPVQAAPAPSPRRRKADG